jgi:drug/metabolite transporter (DMT)-like permease
MSLSSPPEALAKVGPRAGLVLAALGVVYVVWGSTYLGIRIMVEEAPPLTSGGVRFFAAGLLLAAVLAARGGLRRLAVTRRQLAGSAFLGLMLPMLGNGLVSVGEDRGAPSGVTAVLIAVAPLWIVLFRTLDGDRPRPLTLLGVLVGFGGLAYLVLAGSGGDSDLPVGPALIILFASTCWAIGSYVQPRLWLPKDVFVTAVYEMICGGLIMVVVGLLAGERLSADYSARTWGAFAYLVVFGSLLAFTSYVWLLSNAPISLVATYAYVNPVVAVFLGWVVLSEQVTVPILVGGGVVVGAVAIVITAERPRRTPLPEAPVPDAVCRPQGPVDCGPPAPSGPGGPERDVAARR